MLLGNNSKHKELWGSEICILWTFRNNSGSFGGDITDQNVNRIYITRDSIDNLFVADPFDDRVQKFTKECVLVLKFGSSAAADSQFNIFHSVALDLLGLLYVTNMFSGRVHVFPSAIP